MKIDAKHIRAVVNAKSGEDLKHLVQLAIELEHATIPPYLCGYFTLKLGSNDEVGKIIRSVVIEEMLHMTHACNLLLALGGSPAINNPKFVPNYPGELPMGIGENFKVHLRKCSIDQVHDIFMKIEEPEKPIDIPVEKRMSAAREGDLHFDTIGDFYLFLSAKIGELGEDIFVGDKAKQVVASKWFPNPQEMFAIHDVATAQRAIALIIDQGEGSSTEPFVEEQYDGDVVEPAHFYRFQEIVKGKKLIHKPGATPPYVFGGEPVILDSANIWNMDDNPKIAKYKRGSRSRRMAEQFSYSYTRALNSLHATFNGHAEQLDEAMGIMYELRLLAQQVLATPAEYDVGTAPDGTMTGLSFEYQELNL